MCSVSDDIEDLNSSGCCSEIPKERLPNTKHLNCCHKCEEASVVLLQKKDPFCKDCFKTYCLHKFKSTIGKAKVIKHGDHVLVAYSGGICSSAMLDMIQQALEDVTYKKLVFVPAIVHIDERFILNNDAEEKSPLPDEITSVLKNTKYPVFISSLEQVYRADNCADFYWERNSDLIHHVSPTLRNKLLIALENIQSLTSRQLFIEYLRLQLIKDIAQHAGFSFVFLGDSATSLAIKLLTNVAVGRGSQVSYNTTFSDSRSDIVICRPVREFLNKELSFYNHLNNVSHIVLPSVLTKTDIKSSIQRLTEQFVCGLQENFPSTVYAIFRTSGKISNSMETDQKCIFCDSPKDNTDPDVCSALEALNLSSELSKGSPDEQISGPTTSVDPSFGLKPSLCHGCSIILDQMTDQPDFPPLLLQKSLIYSRDRMREEVQAFLLEPE